MYVNKILSLQDPSETFLVRKIIQGCHHSAPSKDSRLPITGPILSNMLKSMDLSVKNLYTRILLKSIFLLAFNAFLRLGEIVVKSKTDQCKVIQRNDATFEMLQTTPVAVETVLKYFKMNKTHAIFKPILKHQIIMKCALFKHYIIFYVNLAASQVHCFNLWEAGQ